METEPKPSYVIRKATSDDVEAIRRMQAQSWRDTYRSDADDVTEAWLSETTTEWMTPERLDESREKLGQCFADPTQFYRVALQGDEVVGLLHLDTKDETTKHLWGLYTAKQTHGTGLAQQLMDLALEWMAGQKVELEVVTYNDRAKAFYRKYGFEEIPRTEELFVDKIPTIKMIREAA